MSEPVDPAPLLAAAGLDGADLGDHPPRFGGSGIPFAYLNVRAAGARQDAPRPCRHRRAVHPRDRAPRLRPCPTSRRSPGSRLRCGPGCSRPTSAARTRRRGRPSLGFAGWLVASGLAAGDGETAYTISQGVEMGRPSVLACDVTASGGRDPAGAGVRSRGAGGVGTHSRPLTSRCCGQPPFRRWLGLTLLAPGRTLGPPAVEGRASSATGSWRARWCSPWLPVGLVSLRRRVRRRRGRAPDIDRVHGGLGRRCCCSVAWASALMLLAGRAASGSGEARRRRSPRRPRVRCWRCSARWRSAAGHRRPVIRAPQFGPAWADIDHNGCDTRDDILRRDLTAIQVAGRDARLRRRRRACWPIRTRASASSSQVRRGQGPDRPRRRAERRLADRVRRAGQRPPG